MHPRLEELAGTLPVALGRLIEAHPGPLRMLLRRGRRVRTGTISWFLALYLISALKPMRRRTLRHAREVAHLERWLSLVAAHAPDNYDLAVEILGARRLVKGYSDTLARGMSKFDRVIGAVPLLAPRQDGATWLRRLRQAALRLTAHSKPSLRSEDPARTRLDSRRYRRYSQCSVFCSSSKM